MSDLLQKLRDEAVSLAEHDLPSTEELRPLFGALLNRLERAAKQGAEQLLDDAPTPVAVVHPSVANQVEGTAPEPPPPAAPVQGAVTVNDPELEAELAAAKARIAELESASSVSAAGAAPSETPAVETTPPYVAPSESGSAPADGVSPGTSSVEGASEAS
jgi:hypothetical protein